MKRNISSKLLIVCCLLIVLISCKSRRQLVVNRKPAETVKVNPGISQVNLIRQKQLYFNTFSGKASTKLDIDGNSNNVTLNIRIERDKRIWVSITAFAGIEGARALITPDSILVINRLQGLYIRKPFSFIYAYASRQVDYKSLEALLIGNAIPGLLNDSTKVQPASGNILLSGNLQELVYSLVVGPDMKVSQTNLTNQSMAQSLQVSNSAFIQQANRELPSQIDIASVVKAKKMQISMHYTRVDFDQPLEFPFNIPPRYQQAN